MIKAHGRGNDTQVHLMIWDTNPKTYNSPDRLTSVNSKVELKKGDVLEIGKTENDLKSKILTINEVLSKKESSLSGYTYYELKTQRSIV